MKRFGAGLLALCLLLLCSCGADVASPSPSHRGTLPSQKPSQAPVQTQALEESDVPEETIQPTAEPTPEPTPDPTLEPTPDPTPEPTQAAAKIHGVSADTIVYVSSSGNKIHRKSNCSGMKNYREMTIADADAKGYKYCSKCW